MRELVIIGAGDQAKDVAAVVAAINAHTPTFRIIGFTSNQIAPSDLALCAPVLGDETALANIDCSVEVTIGINDSQTRMRIDEHLSRLGLGSPVLIHPDTTIADGCRFSAGVVVQAGVRVSRDVYIGRHSFVGHNAVVGHDSVVGDNSSLLPGSVVSGRCSIGHRVQLGASATILPGQRVSDDVSVGAGAVVTRAVPAGVIALGIPAVWPEALPFH